LAASRQCSLKSGLITYTMTGKNCAVPSLRRDTDPAKADNSHWRWRRVTLTNYYRRAVMGHAKTGFVEKLKHIIMP